MVFHVSIDSNILLEDSLDYEDQKGYWENKKKMDAKLLQQMNKEINKDDNGQQKLTTPFDEKKSLRNQFNFQERASQTFNNPIRCKGYKTDPPICTPLARETTQWMIFDSYMQAYEDMVRQEAEENAKNKKDKKTVQVQQQHVEDPLYSTSMKRALKIMERMIVQNSEEEQFQEYKYYEDTTEEPETENYG